MSVPGSKTPVWMTVLIIVCMLPVFSLPSLLSAVPSDGGQNLKTFLWLYPAYVIVAGYLADVCYPTRRYMTWILLVLMLMSHYAMWILVRMPV